jgi:hypothetical protein
MSLAEHTQEMFEDLMFRRQEIERGLEEGSVDREASMRQLAIIDGVLENKDVSEDDLFDQWERDLEEGRIPDLDAMPEGE